MYTWYSQCGLEVVKERLFGNPYFCLFYLFACPFVDVLLNSIAMSTKKMLAEEPGLETGEFDVQFGEGELGMRLEERGALKAFSVVSRVTEDGELIHINHPAPSFLPSLFSVLERKAYS